MVLGDSCTFGWRVEGHQTYAHRVQAILRARGAEVDLLNGGMIGGSPAHSAALLRQLGRRTRPDVVVFGLYPGNDLQDSVNWHGSLILTMGRIEYHVRRLSRFGNWFLARLDPPRAARLPECRFRNFEREVTWVQSHNEIYNTRRLPCPELDGALETMKGDFLDLANNAGRLGGRLAVVQIPDYFTLDPKYYFARDVAEGRDFEQMDPDFWAHWFARELPGIPFYDPTPRLSAGDPYWLEDIHPDAGAHRVIAEVLAGGLEAGGLVRLDPEGSGGDYSPAADVAARTRATRAESGSAAAAAAR